MGVDCSRNGVQGFLQGLLQPLARPNLRNSIIESGDLEFEPPRAGFKAQGYKASSG